MVRSRFNYKNRFFYFLCFINFFTLEPIYFHINFEKSFTFKPWDFLTFKNLQKFLIKRPLYLKKIYLKKIYLKKFFFCDFYLINLIKF
jgi:hypothetical protein